MSGYALWNPSTIYEVNDIIDYDAKIWISLQNANLGRQPNTSPAWWAQMGGSSSLTTVAGGTGISVVQSGTTATVSMTSVGTAGTYAYPASITTDSTGRVSSITAGTQTLPWVDFTLDQDAQAVFAIWLNTRFYTTLAVPPSSSPSQVLQLQGSGALAPIGTIFQIVVAPNSAPSQTLDIYYDITILQTIAPANFGKRYTFTKVANAGLASDWLQIPIVS